MKGLPKPSKDYDQVLMPTEENAGAVASGDPDTVAAVVAHIEDDVVDAKVLRNWRKPCAALLIFVASVFYALFFVFLWFVLDEDDVRMAVSETPNFYIVLALITTIIPTILLSHAAKAIFARKSGLGDTPYTPIQAILHLMKEMKGDVP